MLAITDGVVLVLLVYYVFTGWRKGLLRSLLGPVSLLVCIYAAWAYFQKTHNIAISFSISFFGPMVINFFGSALIRLIGEADIWGRKSQGGWTRVLGAGLNLIWGGAMVAIMLLLFALSPVNLFQTEKIKKDVLGSRTFALLAQRLQGYLPRIEGVPQTGMPSGASDIAGLENLGEGGAGFSSEPGAAPQPQEILPEAKALLEDERVKAMIEDPQVKQLIEEKNYMQLLSNPSFQKILEDPELVMKFLDVHRKMGGQLTLPGAGNPDIRLSEDPE